MGFFYISESMPPSSRFFLFVVFFTIFCYGCSKSDNVEHMPTMEELDEQFKKNWDLPVYASANSASTDSQLTEKEKKIYYYLNILRLNPRLFGLTYASAYQGEQGYSQPSDFQSSKESLLKELENLPPRSILEPNRELFALAKCHASGIGQKGLMTHDRLLTGCAKGTGVFENISYGNFTALGVVMAFLIDYGNPDYGHRKTCLYGGHDSLGTSVQPHITYTECAVLDFR